MTALTEYFKLTVRGTISLSIERVLAMHSNRAIDTLDRTGRRMLTIAMESESGTIRFSTDHPTAVYLQPPSFTRVGNEQQQALTAAVNKKDNDQIGGTFERWPAMRGNIPFEDERNKRRCVTAEHHSVRAAVWASLLGEVTQFGRPLWRNFQQQLTGAQQQKDLLSIRLTTLERFQVPSEEQDIAARFFNVP
jgi:hypothetical protein